MRLPQKTWLRCVQQDDADVGPEAFSVEHNRTPNFHVEIIIAPALCARRYLADVPSTRADFNPQPSCTSRRGAPVPVFAP
jgi:hypothetical protein